MKEKNYESPAMVIVAMQTESAILSGSNGEGMGIQDLTYENIEWN